MVIPYSFGTVRSAVVSISGESAVCAATGTRETPDNTSARMRVQYILHMVLNFSPPC